MHGFSTVDGFVEITECLGEMIKYVANEPSVGLFYVQQHTQNAVPNIINLENNVVEKSRESTLHTEDLEDSITMVRSMKECGFPIADEMIRDIKKSLEIMSKKQPKRGLIRNPISGFQMGRSSSWGPATWGYAQKDDETTSGYFSTVFRSAKQKASNFKWPQLDSTDSIQTEGEKLLVSYHNSPLSVIPSDPSSAVLDTEADDLPLSSPVAGELEDEIQVDDDGLPGHEILSVSENFDDFKADREAKLQEWLEGTSNSDASIRRRVSDAEGPLA